MTSHARRAAGLLVAMVVASACAGPSGSGTPPPASTPASPGSSPEAAAPSPARSPAAAPTTDLPLANGTWEDGVKMPSRRAENAAVALDGKIYLPGGLDPSGKTLATFEAFDTATGGWSSLPPLPEPRDHFGLAVLNGKVYLSGGRVVFSAEVGQGRWRRDPAAA